jgi:hypothetical protein
MGGTEARVARKGVSADQQGRAAMKEYRDNQTIRDNETMVMAI